MKVERLCLCILLFYR